MLPSFNLRLTPQRTLKLVQWLRGSALLAQFAVLLLAVFAFNISLSIEPLLWAWGLLAAAWVLSAWRLRQGWAVTELEVGGQLLIDIAELTWVLYFAGGSSNPFVSAYLVPIALVAVALRPRYGFFITAICISAYTLLLEFYLPLPHAPQEFALHVFGMWVSFILSACLIAGLVWGMAESIRRRDQLIGEAREATLRNEHVVALGALAAGAAHELSTPLSTVGLVADELAVELKDNARVKDDLLLLKHQIDQCRTSLSTLLASADHFRVEKGSAMTVDVFLKQTLDRWQLLRPEVNLTVSLTGDESAKLLSEPGLSQTLINLLNNAADASIAAGRSRVALQSWVDEAELVIEIEDEGTGLDEPARAMAGHAVFSTKPGGAGWGLILSNTTLSRWNGTLSLHNRFQGGTLSRVTIPLPRLKL
ncbi:MAG: ATP-binding protein [Alloalcanivorax venustensis]